MRLCGLLPTLQSHPQYLSLLRTLYQSRTSDQQGHTVALDLPEAARPYIVAALQADWPGPLVIISGKPQEARHIHNQVRIWSATPERVHYFDAPDTIFYDRTPWNRETVQSRVNVLALLASLRNADQPAGRQDKGTIFCASIWSLMAKSVPPRAFGRAIKEIGRGRMLPMHDLLTYCVQSGYEPVAVVEEPGSFGHRGSIVDIYPPNLPDPLRIDFFGDEIDSIRSFDPATQRSRHPIESVTLVPAAESLPQWGKAAAASLEALDLAACNNVTRQRVGEERAKITSGEYFDGIEYYLPYLYPRPTTLLDSCPPGTLLLLDDMLALETAAMGLENQAISVRAEMIEDGELPTNFAVPYFSWEELKARLQRRPVVNLAYGAAPDASPLGSVFARSPEYGQQNRRMPADIDELHRKGDTVLLVTRQAERVADLLREQNVYTSPVEDVPQEPPQGSLILVDGIAAEGWMLASETQRLIVLTDAELFGWRPQRRRRPGRRRQSSPESLFADLEPGDYVVHLEHGIGRYHGLAHKTIANLEREYLEIEYASGDRLFVPIHQADRISRYLAGDDRQPRIHRLGGTEWSTVRARAEKAIRDIAAELLELYAAREIVPGHSFAPDSAWQQELEASFPYEETDDQLRAIAEVKADMERPKPMDRLICGDVGYGKTEVALRAAFKAVMGGKQVAVLVPTTVLAQQHFYTFRRRLRPFPVVVDMLSRFRSPSEQEGIIQDSVAGRVDILIGTHRLLSKDVAFRDIGLLIIDEEQRFGVSHKEHLKALRRQIDVITMTATPIPRTLAMSLSGIRDMSIIDTPPEERLAIRTHVLEYDESIVRKAILREIDRGGQVYYVHNRVQDIELVAEELQRIVPEASLVVGHGQMPENELAQVMLGFSQGEHHVLLCTTIIESGLDIPNVNTIIIDRADTFGLAQLYQLRGRVGRGAQRGYAYLFCKRPLSDVARQRLQAIQEASELGAGFRVAMRDMEIRGAGEILGAEQHGHIAAIGFDLYNRLLRRAVEELQQTSGESLNAIRRAQHQIAAEAIALDLGPSVDLPVSAYLPEEYVPDGPLRLRLYRRLARVETLDDIEEIAQELQDRFGELPDPVDGLLYLLRVRRIAAQAGVLAISGNKRQIALTLAQPLSKGAAQSVTNLVPDSNTRGTRFWLPVMPLWRQNLIRVIEGLRAQGQ